MITKSLLVLVIFALLVSVVSAVSINAEDEMTPGSQWSFTVNFDSLDNVDEGKVFVDGELALTVFEHSGQVYVSDVSSKVLTNNISGTSVVIGYVGLNEGTYTIEAKKYIGGSVDNEQSVSFSVIRPIGQSELDSLGNQINSLETTIANLNSITSDLKLEISTLETALSEKDVELDSLKQKNSDLVGEINQIGLDIDSLENEGVANDEILSTVKDDLNILLTERAEAKKNPLMGLFAAGQSSSALLLALVAVVAVIVIGVFLKKNSSSIYSSSIFSKNDEMSVPLMEESKAETKIVDETETALLDDEPKAEKKSFFSRFRKSDDVEVESSLPKRKWAVESYHPEDVDNKAEEEKGSNLGNLIKK